MSAMSALSAMSTVSAVNARSGMNARSAVNAESAVNAMSDILFWEYVKKEMTGEKELDPNIANRIKLKDNKELLDKLFLDQSLNFNNNTKAYNSS
ncbi:hypothetical protein F8M41_024522 [Gigaspora margarita]|uniref:Uncharacterized protein n=1 Tax=Gigaspora margarita TaxID=4874 RepID=A0A8H4ABG9_GIGMA|nr:hypothetical protein F8M41_024522 [Gigaspora margarita]